MRIAPGYTLPAKLLGLYPAFAGSAGTRRGSQDPAMSDERTIRAGAALAVSLWPMYRRMTGV